MQQLVSTGGFNLTPPTKFNLTQLETEIRAHKILDAEWQQRDLSGHYTDPATNTPKQFEVMVPDVDQGSAAALLSLLESNNVNVKIVPPPMSATVIGMLSV